jgi:hypothetical protein
MIARGDNSFRVPDRVLELAPAETGKLGLGTEHMSLQLGPQSNHSSMGE